MRKRYISTRNKQGQTLEDVWVDKYAVSREGLLKVHEGPFSALVSKDDDYVYAIDSDGKTIAEGEAEVDDASVIQSAVNIGGRVFIGKGEYRIANKIAPPSNTKIEIIGERGAVLKAVKNVNMLKLDVPEDYYIDIIDLTFDQDNLADRAIGSVSGAYWHGKIIRCEFLRAPIGQMNVQLFFKDGVVRDCYFQKDDPDGVDGLGFGADNLKIIDNTFINCAPMTGGAKRVEIADNIIYHDDWGYPGINLEQAYNKDIVEINVHDNILYNAFIAVGSAGTSSTGLTKDINIHNNIGYRSGIDINADPNEFENIKVEGNILRDSRVAAIFARKVKDLIVCHNQIENSNMKNDTYYYNKGCIRLEYVYGKHIIKNNLIKRTASLTYDTPYGVSFNAGDGLVVVEGNTLENMRLEAINIGGSPPDYRIKGNVGYATENSGTATFSGDGSTTQFSIEHGLVSTPSKVQVTAMSSDAAGDFYVTADSTYIYVNYKTAPPSGTDNVKLSWYAEV